jgi:hypothetical protein
MNAEAAAQKVEFDAGNALIFKRLEAFGLIEADGEGGWRITECCKTGLAAMRASINATPSPQPGMVRAWKPRKL